MQRYKPIIDDWKAFREACEKPAVSTVRKNKIKAGEDFEKKLRGSFEKVKRSGWNPDIFRLGKEETPGKSMLHWLGHYYVQEESAALPVEILDPDKGDRILDKCAAPGGKTTQMASKINNNGLVVANDDSSRRMQSLHANIYRTGSACVTATNYDGRQIPEDQKFDRILVDAPCTGEADRARRHFQAANLDQVKGLANLQKQLLEKAERLLKQNGELVYSTCTFAPEENEEVVEFILENSELGLERINPGIPYRRGVEEFGNKTYGSEMQKTVRVYPHHLNSGGIYIAKFRK